MQVVLGLGSLLWSTVKCREKMSLGQILDDLVEERSTSKQECIVLLQRSQELRLVLACSARRRKPWKELQYSYFAKVRAKKNVRQKTATAKEKFKTRAEKSHNTAPTHNRSMRRPWALLLAAFAIVAPSLHSPL